MKSGLVKVLKKAVKVVVISIVSFLVILFLLPYVMPGKISQKIKNFVSRSIDGKIEFSKARLSFFNHFPSLTLRGQPPIIKAGKTDSLPLEEQKDEEETEQ
jgi:AsmA protein